MGVSNRLKSSKVIPSISTTEKYNPYRVPAGFPDGGQFTTAARGGGFGGGLAGFKAMSLEERRIALRDQEKLNAYEIDALLHYQRAGYVDVSDILREGESSAEDSISARIARNQYGVEDEDVLWDKDLFEEVAGEDTYEDFDMLRNSDIDFARSSITNLDNAIEQSTVSVDVVAYRGMNLRHFGAGERGDFSLQEQIDTIRQNTAGDRTFTDPGFLSTSINQKTADSFVIGSSGGVLEVRVPKGSQAIYVDGQMGNFWEDELLLSRDSQFRIIEISSIAKVGGGDYGLDTFGNQVTEVPLIVVELTSNISEKYNPYHDELGRFTSAQGAVGGLSKFAGITGSQEWQEKTENFFKKAAFSAGFSQSPRLSTEEYIQEVNDHLKEVMDESDVAIRIGEDDLLDVLRDGRFKNQHETDSSGGLLDSDFRKELEDEAWGKDTYSSDSERPIYGYLTDDNEYSGQAVSQYGSVKVVLNESIRERTTFTQEDSLDSLDRNAGFRFGGSHINAVPSSLQNPDYKATAIKGRIARTAENADPLHVSLNLGSHTYWEAQIHGGVKISDIDRVVISRHEFDFNPEGVLPLIDELQESGISWSIEEGI